MKALMLFVMSIFLPPPSSVQAPVSWQDPSKHVVRLVTVEPGVQLEVLDWGGKGRTIVLLAGSGNSAHVFDEFAPRLTDCCHVYGITRRGFGNSSQPQSGYDNQRLSIDILQVLDHFDLKRPVLIGHSAAGGEITTIGHQHSERLSGLVYLDALGDPRDWPASDPAYRALIQKLPPGPPATPCPSDGTPSGSWITLKCRLHLPDSELHVVFTTESDGSAGPHKTPRGISDAMGAGEVKRDYSNIRVPVLALRERARTSLDQLLPTDPQPRNEEERATLLEFGRATKAYIDRWAANLTRSVPDARIVDLSPGAGHFLFLTREADVLREIRAFVAHLPSPSTEDRPRESKRR